LRQFPEKF